MTETIKNLEVGSEIIFSDTGDIDNFVPAVKIVKVLSHPEDKSLGSMSDFYDEIAELMDKNESGFIDGSNLLDRKDLEHEVDENCVYFFEK